MRIFGTRGYLVPLGMCCFVQIGEPIRYTRSRDRQFLKHPALDFDIGDAVAFDHLRNELAVLGGYIFSSDLIGFQQV